MSTSLLYHGFGLRGYQHVCNRYYEGAIHFHVSQDRFSLRCPACRSYKVQRQGVVLRRFRTVPIGLKPVWIVLQVQRLLCMRCGVLRQVRVDFAQERRSYTHAFERGVLELSRHMTIRDVSRFLKVSWDVVKDIQKRNLNKRFAKPKLKKLKQIAIDEISIGKGHRYLTIVLDLKSFAVVFVGDGKGPDALEPFWQRLRRSPAWINAVLTHLPEAALVFDHFHVIKLYNDKLSDLRRKLYHEATNLLQKQVIKGTRWLLLKNPENLDNRRREPERLAEALRLIEPLALAYYMKEDLRQI